MELQLGNTLMHMQFRFVNLCVKSDAATLLTVKIPDDSSEDELNIEDVSGVSILDDDNMLVTPFSDDDMKKLRLAIMKEHPEFKQHIENIDLDKIADEAGVSLNPDDYSDEENKEVEEAQPEPKTPVKTATPNDSSANVIHVLVLTVPQVDDDRRKLLLDAVKMQVEACNTNMDTIINTTKVKVAKYVVGLPKEEVDEVDKTIKKTSSKYQDAVEEAEEKKKTEIEEAYQRYLEKHPDDTSSGSQEEDENNAFSMKFDD